MRTGANVPMPNLFDEFRAIVGALAAADVPFAVCGGLAMSIHASPRATIDIDLLAPPQAIPRLFEAVAPIGFVCREPAPARLAEGQVIMHQLAKIVPGDPDVLVLDVIEVRAGATGRAWETRVGAEWEGRHVMTVSADGLIALKKLRGSPQDLADIARLEDEG
jgi:hypothetical protein